MSEIYDVLCERCGGPVASSAALGATSPPPGFACAICGHVHDPEDPLDAVPAPPGPPVPAEAD